MKYPMNNINWNEAPEYNPSLVSDEKVHKEWEAFLKKYKLPANIPHPSEQDWYVEEGNSRWDPSLTVLATPEAVKLYNDVYHLAGLSPERLETEKGEQPRYHFVLTDSEKSFTIGIIGLGGDNFEVHILDIGIPRAAVKPFKANAAKIKKILDDVWDEDTADDALRMNGIEVDTSDVSGFAKTIDHKGTRVGDNNMPKNWWAESLEEDASEIWYKQEW